MPGGRVRSARFRSRDVHMSAAPSSATMFVSPPMAGSVLPPATMAASSRRPRGNGSSSAAPKIMTITAIRTRFATEMSKIDQCTKEPGRFMVIARAKTAGREMLTLFHLGVHAYETPPGSGAALLMARVRVHSPQSPQRQLTLGEGRQQALQRLDGRHPQRCAGTSCNKTMPLAGQGSVATGPSGAGHGPRPGHSSGPGPAQPALAGFRSVTRLSGQARRYFVKRK